MFRKWLFRLAPLLLFLLVAALYARTGGFEFVRLDDHDYTFRCSFVKGGLSWANISEAFTNLRHAAIWMPLTYVTYMADITLFGPGMGAHHLVNVLVHGLNACLLYWFLTVLFGRLRSEGGGGPSARVRLACLLAAAFWALHPLRVEPAAWIAGRKELLCGTFVLLGLVAWLRGCAPFRAAPRLLGWACCLLACLCKPTAMCFPFLALSVELLVPRARGDADGGRVSAWKAVGTRGWTYLPLLAMALLTGLVAVYSQTHADGYDVRSLYTASFGLRLANAVAAVGVYVFETFVPVGLHIDVPFPKDGVPLLWWLQAAGGYALVGVLAWFFRRDRRRLFACALFFLAAVGPVLGLFGSFGREAHADRFTYLPCIAFSLLPLLALSGRPAASRAPGRVPFICAGAAVLVCAVLSCRLVSTWRNDYTVFSRVLACDARHARALSHVASEECARYGRFPDAIAHYRASLALDRQDRTAGELAYALATHGFTAEGTMKRAEYAAEIRSCCASALRDPRSDRKGLMLEALGIAAYWERKWKDAAYFFRWAVAVPDRTRLTPRDDALARLGVALANGGMRKDAEQLFTQLARPGVVGEKVRVFAEDALLQLSSGGRVVLFY